MANPKKREKDSKNQRRKPKQKRALEKYNAVLAACTQVLASYGYEKTTMLELSLESGVAVPTIYQYFSNKEEIFIAWFELMIEQVLESIEVARQQSEAESIDSFINSLINTAITSVDLFRPSIQNFLRDLPQSLVSQLLEVTHKRTVSVVLNMVPAYREQVAKFDIELKLKILISALLGYILQMILVHDEPADTEVICKELSLLVRAYLVESGMEV